MRQGTIYETELQVKFEDFHEKNPQVYKRLVQMAYEAKSRGHKRIGIQMLFEVLRWEALMRTTHTDYKMNNSYASRYARMIMDKEWNLKEIFEVRELKS